ncbi:hypothetical protein D3C79_969240 [compost metagenome]
MVSGKQLFAQAALFVGGLVGAATLQLGDHQVDEIDIAFRGYGASQVEAVQAGFSDPAFQFVGNLARRSHQGDVAPAKGVLVK